MSARILCIVGARPNFIKIAPIVRALALWDGHAAERIAEVLQAVFGQTGPRSSG